MRVSRYQHRRRAHRLLQFVKLLLMLLGPVEFLLLLGEIIEPRGDGGWGRVVRELMKAMEK